MSSYWKGLPRRMPCNGLDPVSCQHSCAVAAVTGYRSWNIRTFPAIKTATLNSARHFPPFLGIQQDPTPQYFSSNCTHSPLPCSNGPVYFKIGATKSHLSLAKRAFAKLDPCDLSALLLKKPEPLNEPSLPNPLALPSVRSWK